jgi:hypothetical protein
MYRAIITPTENTHTIDLPEEFFGKKVEVTIVELSEPATKGNRRPLVNKKISLDELFSTFGSLPNFPTIEEIRNKAWPSKW